MSGKRRRRYMENQEARAFQIERKDNVATALTPIPRGRFTLFGVGEAAVGEAADEIPKGHKVAVRPIGKGEPVIKYGVPIGEATADIETGQWVHLHCMKSCYDERSSGLDLYTGVPEDISYAVGQP